MRPANPRPKPLRRYFRPRLEPLEDRWVPAAIFRQYNPVIYNLQGAPTLSGITSGPDGNLWLTGYDFLHFPLDNYDASFILRVSVTGANTTFYLGATNVPNAITSGPDGNLWFTETGSGQIGRMTPDGVLTEFSTSIPAPQSIIAGPDGNVWFAAPGTIARVTPAGVITPFSVPQDPLYIALGPDGNFWFTERGGNRVGRMTLTGDITDYAVPSTNPGLGSITAGPDGNFWFIESAVDRLGRVTPQGAITEFPLPRVGTGLSDLTAAPDGNVWFTETAAQKVGRITPAGVITEFGPAVPAPVRITTRPDGNLWYTVPSGSTSIGRLQLRPGVVAGADAGGVPAVRVFDAPAGTMQATFLAYDARFTGGVRVAVADLNGDADADVITAPGFGAPPGVKVFDDVGNFIRQFWAYDQGFTGGVYLAAADLNGDGKPEIITGPRPGGGPDVRVFDGATGAIDQEFLAYDIHFSGGVRVAVADVNGDGVPDIVTSPGPGGGPDVRVFDFKTKTLIQELMAYTPGFTGGVFVAAGDVNGDGLADLVTGPDASGGPDVRIFAGGSGSMIGEIVPYNPGFRGGVRVGMAEANVDGPPAIVTAPGAGGGPDVRLFDGKSFAPRGQWYAFDTFSGGVNVAGVTLLFGGQPRPATPMQEFLTPHVGTTPGDITAGPDGNLWFTEPKAALVGRITPAGAVTEIPLPANPDAAVPTGIVTGPDGNLWVTDPSYTSAIVRITPQGNVTPFWLPPWYQSWPITVYQKPTSITVGPDGALWYIDTNGGIGRLTTDGSNSEIHLPDGSVGPAYITTGPDGNLWFTENGASKIARMTLAGGLTEFSVPGGGNPNGVTVGPDGNLWFTLPGTDRIGRVDPLGHFAQFPAPTANGTPQEIAVGPDRNLWFTESSGNSIGRITPSGLVTEFALANRGSQPTGITAGPDGNVWFTEPPRDTVGKLLLPAAVPVPVPLAVTGPDAGGGPDVRVFNVTTGAIVREFLAYEAGFTGGVRVALADVNHDGVPDVVTAPGPGRAPEVRVFDGRTGTVIRDFLAYDPSFLGGVFVASKDLNGDGFAEIVTGPDQGLGPDVREFDGAGGMLIGDTQAYDPGFTGGVRVALGTAVPGATTRHIITAPGPGDGPDIRVLGTNQEFFAYEAGFTGGVYLAARPNGSTGGDDVVTAPGPGRAPEVRVFNGSNLGLIGNFLAYASGFLGGMRVGIVGDLNNDGGADIVTAPGPSGGPDVRVFDGTTQAQLDEFFAYHPAFTGGVFVGGQ